MSVVFDRNLHPLGTHRVLEPAGAMPQSAWKIDNTPIAFENEILCDVEVLNIDSASFKQIADACGGDAAAITEHVLNNVRERGKQHNPVTGSGGMFIGYVLKVGEKLRDKIDIKAGDRIASLVSLTLTPLHIEAVTRIDVTTGRIWIRGKAILFESGLWAKLPNDIDENVALAVLDVAGAPAQVKRLVQPGQTVVVIGADGKSGMLSCAQAKERVGPGGCVIGVAPSGGTASATLLSEAGLVDHFIVADARNTLEISEKVAAVAPGLADIVINCVNVPNTELGSILCTKDDGIVYFFSMSTSFTAAALGAEGVGKDVTMIVGNGYAKGHADTALQTLRDNPRIRAYFNAKYASES
ncbi:MAG TPA: L-erythro-3,5-diaminohexanoate dehydrogenase [Candidatus Baltobacteraceae bacterium]|jgi:L-erythro-3,5-diaminohexanoate dehydrogenase|nr:L-erythro-3,5-diaminohexanoate dehydrogenase [Candidatus Baltobacteraceae bacterium]